MSVNQIWGEASLPGALQPILTVDLAPILDVDDVPITTLIPFVIESPLLTVDGLSILTVNAAPILVIDQGAEPPSYWETADVASDGGVPFAFRYRANPISPDAPAGEQTYQEVTFTISWAAAAVLRVTPFCDGIRDAVDLPDGSTLLPVPVTFVLAQQGGNLERKTDVFTLPLVRRQVRDGVGVARWYLRGQRLEFFIESTGQIGTGEIMIEGYEIESDPVRKAIFQPFDAGGGA